MCLLQSISQFLFFMFVLLSPLAVILLILQPFSVPSFLSFFSIFYSLHFFHFAIRSICFSSLKLISSCFWSFFSAFSKALNFTLPPLSLLSGFLHFLSLVPLQHFYFFQWHFPSSRALWFFWFFFRISSNFLPNSSIQLFFSFSLLIGFF